MKILVFVLLFSFFQQTNLPKFENYPVKEIFTGKPAKVDFKNNPEAWHFRTVIREGSTEGVNFAGHYHCAIWGCGTSCQSFAIINLKNGKVYMSKDDETGLNGFYFKPNSNLFIANPIDSTDAKYELPDYLVTYYYTWDGNKLSKIDSSRSVMEVDENFRH